MNKSLEARNMKKDKSQGRVHVIKPMSIPLNVSQAFRSRAMQNPAESQRGSKASGSYSLSESSDSVSVSESCGR